jgi:uncharacterized membrane protein YjjP (DUF1212 family)
MSPPADKAATALDLTVLAATLLFANGQTTERTIGAAVRVAGALGVQVRVFLRWGELVVEMDCPDGARLKLVATEPAGVDMGKIAAATRLIDKLCDGAIDAEALRTGLGAIQRRPPVSVVRFATMAAAGAAALGVIFGTAHLLSLVVIAVSAGLGACVRRGLARLSRNPLIQPFGAALLAGVVGAIAVRLQISAAQRLIAACPCMVLVPGPHLLNGVVDLARTRIALGAARIVYAGLIIVMICIGLLLGLSAGGVAFPVSGPASLAPLGYDVIAAGIAVAAYGTFFGMPWRMLPVPIVIGMAAHAFRWAMISFGGVSAEAGALAACLLVGTVVTPISDRLRLPFAGIAFASVVSLIPGVYLFRMAGGLVGLVAAGASAPPDLIAGIISDGFSAFLIILAMAFGLICPKMLIEDFWHRRHPAVRSKS